MRMARAFALVAGTALGMSLFVGAVSAQTESATAEDGKSAEDAPATTTTAPSVPVGANLTPPVGLPPGPPLIHPAGTGQSGTSSVSMTPGTLTSGQAREGNNSVRAPAEAEAVPASEVASAPEAEPAPEAVAACSDFPTWYDAQLALESSVDESVIASLDSDGDAIACEEVMYPES
jgi:hypothetical protein